MTAVRSEGLRPVVAASQRVAGIVAARGRGDHEGARALLTLMNDQELSAGALVVAELSLNLLRKETGQSLDQVVSRLCVDIEHSLNRT